MEMEIRELETADYDILENMKTAFYRLWKMKIIVLLMTVIGFLSFIVYISIVGVHTTYSTSAAIYSAVYGSYQDSVDGITVMNRYSSLLNSSRVCDRAANSLQECGITSADIKNMVSSGRIYLSGASSESKSYGIRLTLVVRLDNPEYITEIANAVAGAFAGEINDLLGVSTLQVYDEAKSYGVSQSMNVKLFFLLFGAAAFVMTAAVIFVIEFFSPKVYSVAQCEQNKKYVLGLVPYDNKMGK